MPSESEHLDVLIVGAGLSGIDAAYRLKSEAPDRSWAIFEARDATAGTWDLFRYPGIRSDSDMATLGFPFRPWRGEKSIADGGDIRDYIRDTAREFGIDRRIRLRHRVTAAAWSSADARWTVSYESDGEPATLTCAFLYLCCGYYDYERGHTPTWTGTDRFEGRIVHPQFWPEDMAVSGRRVVVIGSGATAVTLVPALSRQGAGHVTMLQRSPTYIASAPARDELAFKLRRRLPQVIADKAVRWKNIGYGMFVYNLAQRWPDRVKRSIADQQRALLGPDFDIGRHLTPRYDPWDERLCLVPDGDLFKALRDGRATIVTDEIERFDEIGLILRSGERLDADIVVTATGLMLKMMGGAAITVDGERVDPGQRLLYKGTMLEGVPNFAFAVGYTNASWTLKCDLSARFVTRLLNHMRAERLESAVPVATEGASADQPILGLQSGYIKRAAGLLPRQGARAPWRVEQNYAKDSFAFRTGKIDDGVLRFAKARQRTKKAA